MCRGTKKALCIQQRTRLPRGTTSVYRCLRAAALSGTNIPQSCNGNTRCSLPTDRSAFGALLAEGIRYGFPCCLAPSGNSLQVCPYVLVSAQMHLLYEADRHMITLYLPPVKNFCLPGKEFWQIWKSISPLF